MLSAPLDWPVILPPVTSNDPNFHVEAPEVASETMPPEYVVALVVVMPMVLVDVTVAMLSGDETKTLLVPFNAVEVVAVAVYDCSAEMPSAVLAFKDVLPPVPPAVATLRDVALAMLRSVPAVTPRVVPVRANLPSTGLTALVWIKIS
jgi:hypothetical protein